MYICVCGNGFYLYIYVCDYLKSELEGLFLFFGGKEEIEMGGRWLRGI